MILVQLWLSLLCSISSSSDVFQDSGSISLSFFSPIQSFESVRRLRKLGYNKYKNTIFSLKRIMYSHTMKNQRKSRARWLHGDQRTRFFYACLSTTKSNNHIRLLLDASGNLIANILKPQHSLPF